MGGVPRPSVGQRLKAIFIFPCAGFEINGKLPEKLCKRKQARCSGRGSWQVVSNAVSTSALENFEQTLALRTAGHSRGDGRLITA